MRYNYKTALFIILATGIFLSVNGQEGEAIRDKYSLLTMPRNDRPLTLFKGQLQFNAGYKFAVRSRSFNGVGEMVDLKADGNSSVLHYYFIELKYGLTRFLEAGAESYFMKRGVRSESTTYISTSNIIKVNNLKEYKGMGDIFIYSSLRLPLEFKIFDLKLTGGIFLPSAKYEPLRPSHSVTDVVTANSFTVNYHFRNKNGYGVPVYLFSAGGKVRFSKFAAESDLTFRIPVKTGTNIRWDESLANQTFSYFDMPYQYLLNKTTLTNFSFHYQPTGWFNLYLKASYLSESQGWTEYWGLKYRNNEVNLFTLEPGFEIQITPSLTIYQVAGFPLSGKNSDAPFYLFTTLSYNIFPF